MAKKIRIIIDVWYDEFEELPEDEDLRRSVTQHVGKGLLSPSEIEVVEEWDVTIES